MQRTGAADQEAHASATSIRCTCSRRKRAAVRGARSKTSAVRRSLCRPTSPARSRRCGWRGSTRRSTNLPEVQFPALPAERIALPHIAAVQKGEAAAEAHARSTMRPLARWLRRGPWHWSGRSFRRSLLGAGVVLVARRRRLFARRASRAARLRATVDRLYQKLAEAVERHSSRRLTRSTFSNARDWPSSRCLPTNWPNRRKNYHAKGDELVRVIVDSRHSQLDEYSAQPVDPRQCPHDPGHDALAGDAARIVRRRNGVRRRADEALSAFPRSTRRCRSTSCNWRAEMERRFRFNPEHGITLDNLKSIGDAVVRRFKMMQARKILIRATSGSRCSPTPARTNWSRRSSRSMPKSANGEKWRRNCASFRNRAVRSSACSIARC